MLFVRLTVFIAADHCETVTNALVASLAEFAPALQYLSLKGAQRSSHAEWRFHMVLWLASRCVRLFRAGCTRVGDQALGPLLRVLAPHIESLDLTG